MATYQGSFRRGLPRVAGGDYWPPEEDALRSMAMSQSAPGLSESKNMQNQGEPLAIGWASVAVLEHTDDLEEATIFDSKDAKESLDQLQSHSQGDQTVGILRAVRRGLPREAGGDLWPPEETMSVERNIGARAVTSAPVTFGANGSVSKPETTVANSDIMRAAADSNQSVVEGAVRPGQSINVLRRGLPRVAGGNQYPEYTLVEPKKYETVVTVAPSIAEAPSITARAEVPQASMPVIKAPEPRRTALSAPSASAPTKEQAAEAGGRFQLSPNKYKNAAFWTVVLLVQATLVVLAAKGVAGFESVRAFVERYPGETHLPAGDTTGLPGWVRWQHFLNLFFLVLIIRSGLQIRREQRPSAFWTPVWAKEGAGKVSLTVWFHQFLDILWLINGAVFVFLMFATDHWMRIVPTSWEVFPNAASAMLQYVSLDWPTENGWVNYNSLQQLMYALTIFVAAPLAAATGIRMSSLWPKGAKKLTNLYPIEVARAIHFPVMLYFVLFVIIHVALVFSTGILRNLNHMYAGRDVMNWTGLLIFLGSVLLVAGAWMVARPMILAPIASLMGKVSSR